MAHCAWWLWFILIRHNILSGFITLLGVQLRLVADHTLWHRILEHSRTQFQQSFIYNHSDFRQVHVNFTDHRSMLSLQCPLCEINWMTHINFTNYPHPALFLRALPEATPTTLLFRPFLLVTLPRLQVNVIFIMTTMRNKLDDTSQLTSPTIHSRLYFSEPSLSQALPLSRPGHGSQSPIVGCNCSISHSWSLSQHNFSGSRWAYSTAPADFLKFSPTAESTLSSKAVAVLYVSSPSASK